MADWKHNTPRDPRESQLRADLTATHGASPYAPAGGGGAGRFTSRKPCGTRTVLALHASRAPQAARQAGWLTGIEAAYDNLERGVETAYASLVEVKQRTENVYAAYQLARDKYLGPLVLEETGRSATEFAQGLLSGLLLMLVVTVATTVLGAVIGAGLGALAGGVGAAPGAVAGGEAGFAAGVWILTALGIGLLVDYLAGNLGQVVSLLRHGVERAWDAGRGTNSRAQDVEAAAQDLARAQAVLLRLILEAIVMYLLAKGTAAVAERLPQLVNGLKRSRLGKGFAEWVEKNHRSLMEDPKTNPQLRKKTESLPGTSAAGGDAAPQVIKRGPKEKEASKTASQVTPRGFKNRQQYETCMNELNESLRKSGITDAKIGVRGSAVTGKSSKGGPFREVTAEGNPPSDIDVFIESEQLTRGLGESKKIPGFVHPDKITGRYPELGKWSEKWSVELGREITPGGFKSGKVPSEPSVIFGE